MKPLYRRLQISVTYRLRVVLMRVVAALQRMEVGSADDEATVLPGSDVSVAVVITTFQARQEQFCLPLVTQLRNSGCVYPIFVVVNGEPGGTLDAGKRASFVNSINSLGNIHFVMFHQMVGLSRLWNAGIQASDAEVYVVLNDDLLAVSQDCVKDLANLASAATTDGIAIGNGSWSHFAVSRHTLRTVGWFDERYLGFGEEDGDYSWRFREIYGRYPKDVPLIGLVNVKDEQRSDYVTGIGKYSLVNAVMSQLKYRAPAGTSALDMEPPPQRNLSTPDFYPGEDFRHRFNYLLDLTDEREIARTLSSDFNTP